jgi:DNA-binding GntR family transcriptional regulator
MARGSALSIDGLLTVESVRDELAEAILAGRLLPGQELSLQAMAEAQGVRLTSLRQLITRLENDRLLTVRADTAIVAPLDVDTAMRALALRRGLENYLITQSATVITQAEIDELQAMIDSARTDVDSNTFGQHVHEISVRMCCAGASAVEQRTLHDIQDATRRYINLGADAIGRSKVRAGADDDLQTRALDLTSDTLDRLRAGDARAANQSRANTQEQLITFTQAAVEAHPDLADSSSDSVVLLFPTARTPPRAGRPEPPSQNGDVNPVPLRRRRSH